jgi:hypothetical protein
MSPKFDENALAKQMVDEATKLYKDKLTGGKGCCIGVVQVSHLS